MSNIVLLFGCLAIGMLLRKLKSVPPLITLLGVWASLCHFLTLPMWWCRGYESWVSVR